MDGELALVLGDLLGEAHDLLVDVARRCPDFGLHGRQRLQDLAHEIDELRGELERLADDVDG